jgi:predicted PurR-regulated permease PerM
MMVLSALRPDASIFEFLAHRARAASVRRLVADALTGAATIVVALRWELSAEVVLGSAAAGLFAYGAWGILDRLRSRLANKEWPRVAGLLDALCALAVLAGIAAASGMLLAVWAIALGTWIS